MPNILRSALSRPGSACGLEPEASGGSVIRGLRPSFCSLHDNVIIAKARRRKLLTICIEKGSKRPPA